MVAQSVIDPVFGRINTGIVDSIPARLVDTHDPVFRAYVILRR
jgi:hypothetical protein